MQCRKEARDRARKRRVRTDARDWNPECQDAAIDDYEQRMLPMRTYRQIETDQNAVNTGRKRMRLTDAPPLESDISNVPLEYDARPKFQPNAAYPSACYARHISYDSSDTSRYDGTSTQEAHSPSDCPPNIYPRTASRPSPQHNLSTFYSEGASPSPLPEGAPLPKDISRGDTYFGSAASIGSAYTPNTIEFYTSATFVPEPSAPVKKTRRPRVPRPRNPPLLEHKNTPSGPREILPRAAHSTDLSRAAYPVTSAHAPLPPSHAIRSTSAPYFGSSQGAHGPSQPRSTPLRHMSSSALQHASALSTLKYMPPLTSSDFVDAVTRGSFVDAVSRDYFGNKSSAPPRWSSLPPMSAAVPAPAPAPGALPLLGAGAPPASAPVSRAASASGRHSEPRTPEYPTSSPFQMPPQYPVNLIHGSSGEVLHAYPHLSVDDFSRPPSHEHLASQPTCDAPQHAYDGHLPAPYDEGAGPHEQIIPVGSHGAPFEQQGRGVSTGSSPHHSPHPPVDDGNILADGHTSDSDPKAPVRDYYPRARYSHPGVAQPRLDATVDISQSAFVRPATATPLSPAQRPALGSHALPSASPIDASAGGNLTTNTPSEIPTPSGGPDFIDDPSVLAAIYTATLDEQLMRDLRALVDDDEGGGLDVLSDVEDVRGRGHDESDQGLVGEQALGWFPTLKLDSSRIEGYSTLSVEINRSVSAEDEWGEPPLDYSGLLDGNTLAWGVEGPTSEAPAFWGTEAGVWDTDHSTQSSSSDALFAGLFDAGDASLLELNKLEALFSTSPQEGGAVVDEAREGSLGMERMSAVVGANDRFSVFDSGVDDGSRSANEGKGSVDESKPPAHRYDGRWDWTELEHDENWAALLKS